jgi:hypothetical protein
VRLKERLVNFQFSVDAIRARDEMRLQQEQLRKEIQQRVSKAGKGNSAPLDIEAFKAEARRRFVNSGRQDT